MAAKLVSGDHLEPRNEERACRYALGSTSGQWHGHGGHCCDVPPVPPHGAPVRRTRGHLGVPASLECKMVVWVMETSVKLI